MTVNSDAMTNAIAQANASRFVTARNQIPLEPWRDSDRLMAEIASVVQERETKPLSIYVAVPFCSYKCHFCDWVASVPSSVLRSGAASRARYVDALVRQIRHYGPELTDMGYRPHYMYWGGGTPTRLDPDDFRKIHAALAESFDLSGLKQWSVETTPNDLTVEKLDTLLDIGVGRMSVGVQSLNPEQLRKSGRGHSAEQAVAAIEFLTRSAMPSFNVDVMTGFPEEDPIWIDRTLTRLVELGAPHFSVYPFRTSPKTVVEQQVRRGRVTPNTFERQLAAYSRATNLLQNAGYAQGQHHSSWRRDERHEDKDGNYKYGLMGDKIGFGCGAESVVGHWVLWNPSESLEQFVADPLQFASARKFSIDIPDMFINCIGGAQMDLTDGLVFKRFEALTGVSFAELRKLPWTRNMFDYLELCGARFIETADAIRLDPACIDRVLIAHQAHVTDNMRPPAILPS